MIAALVLAAGGSARLGQPKQLLEFHGETLVRRVVLAASEAGCAPVVVVVGRDRDKIAQALEDLPVTLVPHAVWERGIGSSIRAGVAALPEVEAVVILTCDQPQVDAALVRRLIAEHRRTGQPMVGSAYAQTIGIPALFTAGCFPALLALGDEHGAKSLLLARPGEVGSVPFEAGTLDIDTPEDLASWRG